LNERRAAKNFAGITGERLVRGHHSGRGRAGWRRDGFFFNPTTHAFYPVCQFHRLTGLNCPGCGATRALYALLHGEVSTALRDNGLFILALAAAGLRGIWLAAGKIRRRPAGELFPRNWAWPLLFITVVFAVLRNLPAFSFLSPA
jgi:hypothetical protein